MKSSSINYTFAVGQILKNRRRQSGLSQGELAKMVDLSQATISLLERGSRTFSLNTLAAVCGAMDIPLSSVFSEAERVSAIDGKRMIEKIVSKRKTPSSPAKKYPAVSGSNALKK